MPLLKSNQSLKLFTECSLKLLLIPLCDAFHLCPDTTVRQCTVRSAMPPSHFSVALVVISKVDMQDRGPRLITRSATPWQAESTLHKAATDLCDPPEGSCPTRRRTGLSRCCRPLGRDLSAAPAAGEQPKRGEGRPGHNAPRPRPAMDTALGGPALPGAERSLRGRRPPPRL